MTLSERITSILEYSGRNISEFSRIVGFKTPQTVRELIKGNTKTLSDSVQFKLLSAFPDLNEDWLRTGEGEMLKSRKPNVPREVNVDVASRFKALLIDLYKGNITDMAKSTYISRNKIAGIISGEIAPTYDDIRRLAEVARAHINIDWVVTGQGDMIESKPLPEISYTTGVPYYDEDFLLGFDEILAPSNEHPEYLINMPGYERATLWCNASGHSMEPEINNGDIIALQRIEDFSFLPFGDVYGFITTNGMRTIKRLGRSDREGYYKLIPTNKDYDPQEIPVNKIAIVYRVMGAMKAF